MPNKESGDVLSGLTREQYEELLDGLSSEDGSVREKARQSFMSMREKSMPLLIKALSDHRKRVRWEAAKALGQINEPGAARALVKALDDEDFDVRWLASEALISLGASSVVPLLEALRSRVKSQTLREGAHHILNHIMGGDARIEHHIAGHPKGRGQIKDVLAPVVTALDGAQPEMEVPLAVNIALDALAANNAGAA